MSFNVQTLMHLDFPDALCPRCAAILCMDELFDGERIFLSCPVCLIEWDFSYEDWQQFFRQFYGCSLEMNTHRTLTHARQLTAIVTEYQQNEIGSTELFLRL